MASVSELHNIIHALRANLGDTENTVFGITDQAQLERMAEVLIVDFVNTSRAELGDTINTISAGAFDIDRLIRMANAIAPAVNVDLSDIPQGPSVSPPAPDTPPDEITDTPPDEITDVPPILIGNTIIPQGGRLVIVSDPEGSDADALYFVVYDIFGVEVSFEIGDLPRFEELFGTDGERAFSSRVTVPQTEFDESGFVIGGTVDTIVGAEESLGSLVQREIRALGLEDIPQWVRDDPEAMVLIITGQAEGWSSGRLWGELSSTDGFGERFAAIDQFLVGGVTLEQAIDDLVTEEASLRTVLRRRGVAGVEAVDLQDLLTKGWTSEQADEVLEAEQFLLRNPDALAEANLVLVAAGLTPLDELGLINAMRGEAPADIMEVLNEASAFVALSEAGFEDLDVDLIRSVVDDFTGVLSRSNLAEVAQGLAFSAIANQRELDAAKFGLSRDSLIAAAFGEEDPEGRSPAEVMNLLAKFGRERQVGAAGLGGSQAFVDPRGRLRIQGLSGI